MTALSTSSTNDVNTANPAYEVSTVSSNVNIASPQSKFMEDDLEAMDLKWQLSLLSMRAKRYDKSKVECFNYHKMGHFARECRAPRNNEGQLRNQDNTRKKGNNEDTSSKAMLAIDGVGFDWSDMAEEQVQTNMALMAFSDSKVYNDKTCSKTCLKNCETLKKQCDDLIIKLNQTEFTVATYKRGLATVEEQLITYRKNQVLFSEEVTVLKREVPCKDYEINVLKKPEFKGYGSENSKQESNIVCDQKSDDSKENFDYSLVKEQVESSFNVDKETVFPVDKKVKFVKPKNHEKPVKKSVRLIANTIKGKGWFTQKVNTAKVQGVNTASPKVVKNARPNSAVVNAIRANQGKPQQDDTGFVDSGCSRHMTRNIAYLFDFKEFDRGYVTFGGGEHGGRISDSLGKFDGKSDECFFVGYSLSSKAFRVYNTRTRKVEENLHIGFLENKPMIEGNGPKWLFDIDSLTQSMNYVPITAGIITNESVGIQREFNAGTSTKKEEISQDYIVMLIWKDASYFDSPSKDVDNGEPKSAADDQKQVEDGPDNENDEKDNPKDMFTMGASHTLKVTHVEFFSDEDEPEVDLGNIINSYTVPTTPNTRIHKDHPIKNVIGDVESSVQTKRMTKPTSKQGFLSAVWILVDLSIRKRAIGTKWVFRNKKDERGIVIRNKARLVAQGHRQEEGIDYEEVFAHVARIEAIRLFLAYASFMGFLVYQMDVNSAFSYGTIEEKVYVTQPPGFKDPDHPNNVYKVVKALLWVSSSPKSMIVAEIFEEKFNYEISMIGSLMYLTASRPDIMFACKKKIVVATSTTEAEYVATVCCWWDKYSGFKINCWIIDLLTKGFDAGSHIYYALTASPTIYTSLIEQFWQTAALCTIDDGVLGITATIDRKVKITVSEVSIRRHLKLEDSEGIPSLPTAEIFEAISRMILTSTRHGIDLDATASFILVTTDGLEINTANIAVSTVDAVVTTASSFISTVSPPRVSTAEDISGAETLVNIRRSASKAKDKGKAIILTIQARQQTSHSHTFVSPPLAIVLHSSSEEKLIHVRGLKDFKMILRVTAAQLVQKVYAAGLQLLEELLMIGINKWYQSFALRNFDLEVMEFKSAHSNTTAKLPILKLGEYEMWVIRIKQYFQLQDYAQWEVIENGNLWVSVPQTAQENGTSVTKMFVPVTVEEKTNKKNDVKARSLLLMALSNEHQLTFRHSSSIESLDSIFNKLQKIVSRLAILGVVIAQEDLNSKFLNSLRLEWNTHVVVWINKAEIETMSIDDFTSSTNDINTAIPAYELSTASPNVNTTSPQVSTASFSDNAVYAFMVENPNGFNLLQQDLEQIHEDDLEAMDLK
ncbi:putative ribonuclease H-like domain-containing protein [Tanacetum coccineum]